MLKRFLIAFITLIIAATNGGLYTGTEATPSAPEASAVAENTTDSAATTMQWRTTPLQTDRETSFCSCISLPELLWCSNGCARVQPIQSFLSGPGHRRPWPGCRCRG